MSRRSGSIDSFRRLRSIGSSRTSIPGPIDLAPRPVGKTCKVLAPWLWKEGGNPLTLVWLHPSLNAHSCASSSPKPSIMPFMKGSNRFMAAPLNMDQTVGGWYIITGRSPLLLEDCGGDEDGGDSDEYASESEGIVNWEVERSCGGEGGWSIWVEAIE